MNVIYDIFITKYRHAKIMLSKKFCLSTKNCNGEKFLNNLYSVGQKLYDINYMIHDSFSKTFSHRQSLCVDQRKRPKMSISAQTHYE